MRPIITYCVLSLCVLSQLRDIPGWTGTSIVAAAGQSRSQSDPAISASSALAIAQTVIPAGEQITLHSKILGEDRNIFVALPVSYAGSDEKYPVLYLTDAQLFFDSTRSTAAFLARERIIPDVIVVGVTNPDRTRDLYATRADFKRDGLTDRK